MKLKENVALVEKHYLYNIWLEKVSTSYDVIPLQGKR